MKASQNLACGRLAEDLLAGRVPARLLVGQSARSCPDDVYRPASFRHSTKDVAGYLEALQATLLDDGVGPSMIIRVYQCRASNEKSRGSPCIHED